ncbi:UNVERIFIED_CONTAM: hypothetical protein FKN15_050554 [Acipenser sinensis]
MADWRTSLMTSRNKVAYGEFGHKVVYCPLQEEEELPARRLEKAKLGEDPLPSPEPEGGKPLPLPVHKGEEPLSSSKLEGEKLPPGSRVSSATAGPISAAATPFAEGSTQQVSRTSTSIGLNAHNAASTTARLLSIAAASVTTERENRTREEEVGMLSIIGGGNLKATTCRLMSTTISNDLAVQFNWVGRGVKRAFKDLLLKNIIFRAVRANVFTKSATEEECSALAMNWPRYAKDRSGGRRQRSEAAAASQE